MRSNLEQLGKNPWPVIPPYVLTRIESAVADMEHGSVTLIVQEARIIQMDKIEKIRFVGSQQSVNEQPDTRIKVIRSKVPEAIRGLEYGQINIIVKNGLVVQIDRTEKFRLPKLDGMYGDGI